MQKYQDLEMITESIIQKVGKNITLATPLGAGKANSIINSIYARAKVDKEIELTILTALTLQKPIGKSDLEKKFLEPFVDRVFGNYPNLDYDTDRQNHSLPGNIKVIEFYFAPGKLKTVSSAQQCYLSSNYTHVARDIISRGVNVICQQVSKGEVNGDEVFSLSCNPDITVDIVEELREQNKNIMVVAQVNQELPFMYGESIVAPEFFDAALDNRSFDFRIFGLPKMSVSDADYMIGLYASTLVKDDGEIQIGIGSLGDALVYALCLRENDNLEYRKILEAVNITGDKYPIISNYGSFERFKVGLFAATEMFVDSFVHLFTSNILKKKVYDSVILQRLLNKNVISEIVDKNMLQRLYEHKAIGFNLSKEDFEFLKEFGIFNKSVQWSDGLLKMESGEKIKAQVDELPQEVLGERLRNGAVAHAGFFVGEQKFYQFLKDLPIEQRKLIRMKRISQINHLYGHETIDRLQRKNGRFINTCMKVTLNGSVSSDALDDGTQISGVGGQYNFVAMAHELPDARSILQLRSIRINNKGQNESNIVFNYGHCTIPKHLRDVVITEYGIADLRAKTDEEVAVALIKVADSRFQKSLLTEAKNHNKVGINYVLPSEFCNNYPQSYKTVLGRYKEHNQFQAFPFGTDFTSEEIKLGKALKYLKSQLGNRAKTVKLLMSLFLVGKPSAGHLPLLKRMNLHNPSNLKEKVYAKLVLRALCLC
ncbi:MAG: hypothetical protein HOO06_05445 [Bdellovibrionaceae bacterium]|jgi:acyl-CoA hydrolase|nr:hypothetical protein [Pseudobdellovibrionaceae bacterium]